MKNGVFAESGTFLVLIDGREYHVPRHCPHRGGRLDHGLINEKRKTVTCPLHKSTFDLSSGCQLAGPECGKLDVRVLERPDGLTY